MSSSSSFPCVALCYSKVRKKLKVFWQEYNLCNAETDLVCRERGGCGAFEWRRSAFGKIAASLICPSGKDKLFTKLHNLQLKKAWTGGKKKTAWMMNKKKEKQLFSLCMLWLKYNRGNCSKFIGQTRKSRLTDKGIVKNSFYLHANADRIMRSRIKL